MKTNLHYFQLIPEKVLQNLDEIEATIKLTIKGYSTDYLKEVISTVSFHVQKENGNAQIGIKYIKSLVPQGDKYFLALKRHKIISRYGPYVCGKASYRYNFTPEYRSKYIQLPLLNIKLINRIEHVHKSTRKDVIISTEGHNEQVKYLKKTTLEKGYQEFVNTTYSNDLNRYNYATASATRVINKDFFYKVDQTSGRFHSNLTNMPKELRTYIRINGEPLANIDIKNSQPYLSTMLFTCPRKISSMAENPKFAELLRTLRVRRSKDALKYIELVVSGKIYEFLMEEFSKAGLVLNRDETKVQVLRILFARNRSPKDLKNRKARQIFIKNFPTVHKVFSDIRGNKIGDHFTDFRRFAVLLQKIESYLILDVILKRIYRELPGTIAITIHDSILTGILPIHINAVKMIMEDELTKFVGFTPQIKVEV